MRQVILHRRDNIRAKFRQSIVSLYGGQCTVKWFQSTVEPLQYQSILFLFTCSSIGTVCYILYALNNKYSIHKEGVHFEN